MKFLHKQISISFIWYNITYLGQYLSYIILGGANIANSHIDNMNESRLTKILVTFPDFLKMYLDNLRQSRALSTTLAYAYDLSVFLSFLIVEYNEIFSVTNTKEITLCQFDKIDESIIFRYLDWLNSYSNQYVNRNNSNAGKKRKLEAIKNLYCYLYRNKLVTNYPVINVRNPVIIPSEKKLLNNKSVNQLFINISTGANQSDLQKKKYHTKTVQRDLAIVSLLLEAGLRSSECARLNINDIELNNKFVIITKSNFKKYAVPVSDCVIDKLNHYLDIRIKQTTLEGHEAALFLSMQRRRIEVRTIEKLTKKYTEFIKELTPMALRKTFGNIIYTDNNDVILVTNLLGNNDIYHTMKNTIDKCYSENSPE